MCVCGRDGVTVFTFYERRLIAYVSPAYFFFLQKIHFNPISLCDNAIWLDAHTYSIRWFSVLLLAILRDQRLAEDVFQLSEEKKPRCCFELWENVRNGCNSFIIVANEFTLNWQMFERLTHSRFFFALLCKEVIKTSELSTQAKLN